MVDTAGLLSYYLYEDLANQVRQLNRTKVYRISQRM